MSDRRDPIPAPRDVERGRMLNDLFDAAARGEPVRSAALRAGDAEIARELCAYAGLARDLGLARGDLGVLLAHGVLERSDDPRYPARLGPYFISEYIGQGGMGLVFKAYEPPLRRTLALKLLKPEMCREENAVERFTREARAAAALNHPNIVTVHAVGERRGVHYIAMEYVAGPSLAEVIRGSRQPAAACRPSDISEPERQRRDQSERQAQASDQSEPERQRRDQSERQAQASDQSEPERQRRDQSERQAQASDQSEPERQRRDQSERQAQASDQSEPERQRRDQSEHQTQASVSPERAAPPTDSRLPILTPATIREIFRQLLEALAAAHAKDLIHRDVKSSNILLEIEGTEATRQQGNEENAAPLNPESRIPNPFRVKLADFGLARMQDSQTRLTLTNATPGTPEYMSPEQARGDADIDHRTDLYSAGVVMYELLTGRTPFHADTPSGLTYRICNVEPPPPSRLDEVVDPVLASLALRLMAKRPRDRFESARAVLQNLGVGQPVALPHKRRRLLRRAAIAAACLVALVAIAGGATELLKRSSPVRSLREVSEVHVTLDNNYIEAVLQDGARKNLMGLDPGLKGNFCGAKMAEFPSEGQPTLTLVVAGRAPVDAKSNVVIAYNEHLNERWRRSLTPIKPTEWPDDDKPGADWGCEQLLVADVDGRPGDEILVIGNHETQYPARVSIIDPDTGDIRVTFWHFGHLDQMILLPDFFEENHPALALKGLNNKCDGFDQYRPGETRLTINDKVPIVMILDPRNMDGVGPPWTDRISIPRAMPYAYGFLDLPASEEQRMPDGTKMRHEYPIRSVSISKLTIPRGNAPGSVVTGVLEKNDNQYPGLESVLVFDRDLNVIDVEQGDNAPKWLTREDLKSLWMRIVPDNQPAAE